MTAVELAPLVAAEGQTEQRDARARRKLWRRSALVLFGAVFVVELVLLAPLLTRALTALDRPDWRWLAFAVAAELVSMGAFARVQRRMLSAGGARVPMCRMAALTYAANAVSVTFPGGAALSSGYVFRRLRSWGATVPAAGFTIVASGALSTLAFALLAVICAVLAGRGGLSSMVTICAVVVLALAAVWVRRRWHEPNLLARIAARALNGVNRIRHREPDAGLAALQRFTTELSAIKPRSRDWAVGLGFAGLNWVADLACLVACCQAVGANGTSLVLVLVAYIAGMSTSSLSLVPGGLGVVDAAMIFALTQGGVSIVSATAGVLLYRLISFALVVALGWLVWAATWFMQRRGEHSDPSDARATHAVAAQVGSAYTTMLSR
jgi:putative heme transporter